MAHGLATDSGRVPVPGSVEPFPVRRHRVHKWVPRTVHSSNRKIATAIRTDKGASGTAPSPGIKEPRRYSRDTTRSEEHTSELQSRFDLVCRLLLEKI